MPVNTSDFFNICVVNPLFQVLLILFRVFNKLPSFRPGLHSIRDRDMVSPRLIGHHITNDTHRGMLISVSRPSSAARSSLLSSGVSARPEVQKLVYQMPMFTEIPGDRGPREQTQHRSIIRGYINAQTEVLKSSLMERASSYPFHYYYMH